MQPENTPVTSPASVFLLRGHRVQVYNYESGKVLAETKMEGNPELLELKGHHSGDRRHYVVFCPAEMAIFNLAGEPVVREAEKVTCKAKFIEHSSRFFFKVVKQSTTYVISVSEFDGKKLTKLGQFEANYFKSSFDYVRLDDTNGIVGVQVKPDEVQLFSVKGGKLVAEQAVQSATLIHDFYVRPGSVYLVVDDLKDGKPTVSVLIYKLGPKPVLECKRVFNNVQEAKIHASDDGSVVLVNAHRFMDTTGNSYYGLEKVFYYNHDTKLMDEVVTYKGSIHDVKLAPSQKHFMIVSGTVPMFSVLYDAKNSPQHLMSHDFRNSLFFAPNGAFVAVAGFGALSGEIEIWNYQKKEFIGGCKSDCASFLKWSADSAFFVTAIVADKLKVDHRFTVFAYNGTLIKRVNLDPCDLITVEFAFWRPTDQSIVDKPQKRAKEPGSLIKHKMEPQKIDADRIKNYLPGEPQVIKLQSTKPTLTVGGVTKEGSGGGAFFNSKKEGAPNKFKVQKQ